MKKQGQKKRRLICCGVRDEETHDTRKGIIFDGKSQGGGCRRKEWSVLDKSFVTKLRRSCRLAE